MQTEEPTADVVVSTPVKDEESTGGKRRSELSTDVEPEAKKQCQDKKQDKQTLIRKQIEYYFSDENMKRDRFFHPKIMADPEVNEKGYSDDGRDKLGPGYSDVIFQWLIQKVQVIFLRFRAGWSRSIFCAVRRFRISVPHRTISSVHWLSPIWKRRWMEV